MTNVIAAPSVRTLAGEKGIDLEKLARDLGRTTIAREDLEREAPAPAPAGNSAYWEVDHGQYGPVEEEPMSRMGQVAAANLAAANSLIPQVTHHDRAEIGALGAFRKTLRSEAQARGGKLTSLAFHVKALARALREFPRFNASLSADGKRLILKDYVHVGIAVDTAQGLLVPVIRNADKKGLWQIAAYMGLLFVFPMAFGEIALLGAPTAAGAAVGLAYAAMQSGILLIKTATRVATTPSPRVK
mgnify:CR=1 FL=1